MLKAVCALIPFGDNTFVAVSRKTDHTMLGLPGGKVEDGEDPVTALIRELSEELDLPIKSFKAEDFIFSYQAICKGEVDYDTSTYIYKGTYFQFTPTFINSEGALVKPMTIHDLVDPLQSPFHVYNTQLKEELSNG